jgi:hypothetical protein
MGEIPLSRQELGKFPLRCDNRVDSEGEADMPQQLVDPELTIRERAYFLWKEAGKPAGRDGEFWERATQSVAASDHLLIFAYGSNMNTAVITKRCPGAQFVGQARIPDHQLCFPRWVDSHNSFAAGFSPTASRVLRGVVWRIPVAEIPALDMSEGGSSRCPRLVNI